MDESIAVLDSHQLAAVVRSGLFDAPHPVGNPAVPGQVVTVPVSLGRWVAAAV